MIMWNELSFSSFFPSLILRSSTGCICQRGKILCVRTYIYVYKWVRARTTLSLIFLSCEKERQKVRLEMNTMTNCQLWADVSIKFTCYSTNCCKLSNNNAHALVWICWKYQIIIQLSLFLRLYFARGGRRRINRRFFFAHTALSSSKILSHSNFDREEVVV